MSKKKNLTRAFLFDCFCFNLSEKTSQFEKITFFFFFFCNYFVVQASMVLQFITQMKLTGDSKFSIAMNI